MVKRLLVGLVLGVVLGGILGVGLVQGLGLSFVGTGGAVLAYLSAAVVGVLTGLVAGKPIWSADGKIEAGLKAFFGGLLALGGMFALRQWVHVNVDLTSLKAGAGELGQLPLVALPLVAAALGALFELDNTPPSDEDKAAKEEGPKARIRIGGAKAKDDEEAEDDAEADEGKARRK